MSLSKEGLEARVTRRGECWEWQRDRGYMGHGIHYEAGTWTYAHRIAFQLYRGDIAPGLIVHHVCENPPCVNPAHLRAITRAQHAAEHGLTGAAAANAAATTCSEGHPFDHSDGHRRICLACKRRRGREWARAKRMARSGAAP